MFDFRETNMCYFPVKVNGKFYACGYCYCCTLAKRNGFFRRFITPTKPSIIKRICAIIQNILKI